MSKPTIQIDPKSRILSDPGAIKFAAACVEETVRLEQRGFSGMSLKLYTNHNLLDGLTIAEFYWQGIMAIRMTHQPSEGHPEKTYLNFPLVYSKEAQSWRHFRLQDCMIEATMRRVKDFLDLWNGIGGDIYGKKLEAILKEMRPDFYQ